jgi:hypothetical protein
MQKKALTAINQARGKREERKGKGIGIEARRRKVHVKGEWIGEFALRKLRKEEGDG